MFKYTVLLCLSVILIFSSGEYAFSEENSDVTKFQQYNQKIQNYDYYMYNGIPAGYYAGAGRGKFGYYGRYYSPYRYNYIYNYPTYEYLKYNEYAKSNRESETLVPADEYSVSEN